MIPDLQAPYLTFLTSLKKLTIRGPQQPLTNKEYRGLYKAFYQFTQESPIDKIQKNCLEGETGLVEITTLLREALQFMYIHRDKSPDYWNQTFKYGLSFCRKLQTTNEGELAALAAFKTELGSYKLVDANAATVSANPLVTKPELSGSVPTQPVTPSSMDDDITSLFEQVRQQSTSMSLISTVATLASPVSDQANVGDTMSSVIAEGSAPSKKIKKVQWANNEALASIQLFSNESTEIEADSKPTVQELIPTALASSNMLDSKFIDALIEELSPHHDYRTQLNALTVLAEKNQSNFMVQAKILGLGGIDTFYRLLNSPNNSIKEKALLALCNQSFHPLSQPIIARHTALKDALRLLSASSDAWVSRRSQRILDNVAHYNPQLHGQFESDRLCGQKQKTRSFDSDTNAPSKRSTAPIDIKDLLRELNSGNSEWRQLHALTQLRDRNQNNSVVQAEILKLNGIDILIALLKSPNIEIKKNALTTLLQQSFHPSSRPAMFENKEFICQVRLSRSLDWDIANAILDNFARYETNRKPSSFHTDGTHSRRSLEGSHSRPSPPSSEAGAQASQSAQRRRADSTAEAVSDYRLA